MSGSSSSVGMNYAGCYCGPHSSSDTPAEQQQLRECRLSAATQPRSDNFSDRLACGLPSHDRLQHIQTQVNILTAQIPKPGGKPKSGS
ncbi:hypothetical protein F5Y19DRAFT_378000 [Xylariaceae sp. FL1651]|nr:hypothetical protein F5Y19DRAFT_378000 [Xylariaceae sp. FL1651]